MDENPENTAATSCSDIVDVPANDDVTTPELDKTDFKNESQNNSESTPPPTLTELSTAAPIKTPASTPAHSFFTPGTTVPVVIQRSTNYERITTMPIKPMVVIESAKVISCVLCNKYATCDTNKRIYKLTGTKAAKENHVKIIEAFTGRIVDKLLLEFMYVCDPCVKLCSKSLTLRDNFNNNLAGLQTKYKKRTKLRENFDNAKFNPDVHAKTEAKIEEPKKKTKKKKKKKTSVPPVVSYDGPRTGEKMTTLNISLPHNISGIAEKGKQLFKTLSIALPPHVTVEQQPEISIQRKTTSSRGAAAKKRPPEDNTELLYSNKVAKEDPSKT